MTVSASPPARYDEFAGWYEDYISSDAGGFTRRAGTALAEVLGPGTGPVLDLACGTGVQAQLLRTLGWTPFGTDISQGQLAYARARLAVVRADAAHPPIRADSLAAVVSVACHTDVDDYAAVCLAIGRMIKPGGVLAHVGLHPCFIGAFSDRSDPARVVITPGYWNTARRFDAWSDRGVRAKVGATHLPLSSLLAAFIAAGLTIERVVEVGDPVPDILAVRCVRNSG